MVKYTRRHFQEIAALISKVPAAQRREEAERYASMFRADNPRFDEGKFIAACKLDAENVGSCGCKAKGKKKPKNVGKITASFGKNTTKKQVCDGTNAICSPNFRGGNWGTQGNRYNAGFEYKGRLEDKTAKYNPDVQTIHKNHPPGSPKPWGSCGAKKKSPKRVGNMEAGRQAQWDKFKASGRIEQYPAMYKKLQTASDTQLKNLRGFAKALTPNDIAFHKSYDSYVKFQGANPVLPKAEWQVVRKANLTGAWERYVADPTKFKG